MARKPKVLLSPDPAAVMPAENLTAMGEAPPPPRRGRKAKAAAPSPKMLPPAGDNTAVSGGKADVDGASPVDAPRRRGPNRKPKPSAPVVAATPRQELTKRGQRGQSSRPFAAGPSQDATKNDGQDAATASPPVIAAGADPVQMDADPGSSSDDAQQPSLSLNTPSPAKPAAHWDRATDTGRFDWPAIQRTAASDGPNQGMAKLLITARADGANSRWPL